MKGCPLSDFKNFKFKKISLKMLGGFFMFYLVRDSILYVLVPALIAKGYMIK